MDRTLSGANNPGQSGSESDDNEGVLCIPKNSDITGASPSHCLMPYQDTHGGYYSSAKMQLVYSMVPINWALIFQ